MEVLQHKIGRVGLRDQIFHVRDPALAGILAHPHTVHVDSIHGPCLLRHDGELLFLQGWIGQNIQIDLDPSLLRKPVENRLQHVRLGLGHHADVDARALIGLASRRELVPGGSRGSLGRCGRGLRGRWGGWHYAARQIQAGRTSAQQL